MKPFNFRLFNFPLQTPMKVLISPDKFKSSLTADEVCAAIERGIHKFDSSVEVHKHPLADGGEGTLDILGSTMSMDSINVEVNDPLFRPINAEYRISDKTAYIEMAAASGLPLLKESERNCLVTTTYGTGELMLDAISKGVKEIYLFVGGSATNEGGIGRAAALGYKFYAANGEEIEPIGQELVNLARIDDSNLKFNLEEIRVTVVCDVKTVLYGPEGATYIYGRQKGANDDALKVLDSGLENFAEVVNETFGKNISNVEGAGAAGGIAGGAVVFVNGQIKPGIQTIIEITGYEEKLKNVDLVITGEGKLDIQTVHGKVIYGVNKTCSEYGIPYSIICGIAEDLDQIKAEINAEKILQVKCPNVSLDSAINEAAIHVEQLAYELISEKDN